MIFRNAIGFDVPADVSFLRATSWAFADSEHGFVTFVASQETVNRIVARGLTRAPASYFPRSNVEPPRWWVLPTEGDVVRYYRKLDESDYARDVEVLIYDRVTNRVYFHWIGID